jgi:hypothetical protein
MFDALNTEIASRGFVLAPDKVISDFESCLPPSIAQKIPFSTTQRLLLSFCQVVWRQVQHLGLASMYGNDANIRQQVCQLLALAFAPVTVVRSTFNDLQLNADPALGQLFTYFNDQWLTRIPVPMLERVSGGRMVAQSIFQSRSETPSDHLAFHSILERRA